MLMSYGLRSACSIPLLLCLFQVHFFEDGGFSIQPIQIRLSGPCIICCNRILTKKIVKQLEIIDKNFVEIYNEKDFMIFGINMQLWKGELMNIQEIQHQLHLFHQKASVVKEQLTDLLVTVSDGRVPSVSDMSALCDDVTFLRTQYQGIYGAAKELTTTQELPEMGKSVDLYVQAAENSRGRVLRQQMKEAEAILTRFAAVQSTLDMYAMALKPYQDAASQMLAQISEETIGDILPQTQAPAVFIQTMEMKNPGSSPEGFQLMQQVSQHYPWAVQMGLSSNQYFSATESQVLKDAADGTGPDVFLEKKEEKEDAPESLPQENGSDLSTQDEREDIGCREEQPAQAEAGEEEEKELFFPSNKLKGGTPSASAFRKDIIKMAKINREIRTVLPLLTNLGFLTKEQCFLFGACMDCYEETDQEREYVSSAMDALAAKGYLACFEYEREGEKVAAYCIADHCSMCMRKESIASQMKGFWALSFGNYKVPSDTAMERETVIWGIQINRLLLKYIYAAKQTLSEKEFFKVKNSIIWKNGYYQVAVFENGKFCTCRLVGDGENVDQVEGENLLLCVEEPELDALAEEEKRRIFVLHKGTISLWGKKPDTDDAITGADAAAQEDAPLPEREAEEEDGQAPEDRGGCMPLKEDGQDDAGSAGVQPVEEKEHPASTPAELLQKDTLPADDEFCQVVCNILNREAATLEELKTIILNGVLLAYGAGLEEDRRRSEEFSLQLRLATNVLTESSAYTSERLAKAFPHIDGENEAMALAAYLFAMLAPSRPFDYGLINQTRMLFDDYEIRFADFPTFKPLFNKLVFLLKNSSTGLSPGMIALLGSKEKNEAFIDSLKKRAKEYLTVQMPKARMKALPILYADCFGSGSDLYNCMVSIGENKKEDLEMVQLTLHDFCDVQNSTYVLNETKIVEYLDNQWSSKNKSGFKLAYDAYNQTLKQIRVRLEVMLEWTEHISRQDSGQENLNRLRGLRDELLEIVNSILKDAGWKQQEYSNVLWWALRYMQKYLNGDLDPTAVYSDLLFTGVISLDQNGAPLIDPAMHSIRFYEPWRNALRHITAVKKSAEELRGEIRGDILGEGDEEAGLKDNLHQLELLGKLLGSEEEDYQVSEEQMREAVDSAEDRTVRFQETLELAYTYNQINETEKETLSGMMEQYKEFFYEVGDFACWRRFLEALERQVQAFAAGRKKELRIQLDARRQESGDFPLLQEADRLLEEDANFAVTEEYITRFDNGERELEDELDVIIQDKDYFGEFLQKDRFDELLLSCRQGKGRALKSFGWDYVDKHLPKDWTNRNREDSKNMINCWPSGRGFAAPGQMQNLFRCLGFDVIRAEKKDGHREEMFQIWVKPTARSMADYRHPIAAFGTQIHSVIHVIVLYGNYTERQLVDTVSSLDLGGISIVLIDQPIDGAARRMIGEIFHTQTSGQNPFLLIDQVLFLYLAMHQQTERLPALLKCTLPYATYQPFVRDGGSTADEMFCGRSRELSTIIDPNGACVVYGGRQLGKTALLERAESRCSKPENKEYAVYSTIIRIHTEEEVVETLIRDMDRKTGGAIRLTKCRTLKELCAQLSQMFMRGQITRMHLLIDEVDCFLEAISQADYTPLQPLVDLKRETKNNFKFVLTGLHNVYRAKNATKENGVFGQLGTPLCIKPLSPTDALKLLSRPLNYLGFQIDCCPHLETILTNTNYYPGILQFFGYMLVETLTGEYSKYYRAANGNPPFTLQDEQLGAVMNSADLNKSIKDKFRLSLELDARYFMIARCITMLYHLYEKDRTAGSWRGFEVEQIREIADSYKIHCLEKESADSFRILMDEMVEMGILSQPKDGLYRLRRSSFVDIIGENADNLEKDIIDNNEVES